MKITITYYDSDSLTVEEVVRQAKHNYGEYVHVEVMPSSDDPKDLIYFALQKMITYEQLSLIFDAPHQYESKMHELRACINNTLNQELDAVIRDNEKRIL